MAHPVLVIHMHGQRLLLVIACLLVAAIVLASVLLTAPVAGPVQPVPPGDPDLTSPTSLTSFQAGELTGWRRAVPRENITPRDLHPGFRTSRTDPTLLVGAFPNLQVRNDRVFRAYVVNVTNVTPGGYGIVFATDRAMSLKAPSGSPPTLPEGADRSVMNDIRGDDSPASYIQASLLRRELDEFGRYWHNLDWSLEVITGRDPLAEKSPEEAALWKWEREPPQDWTPRVEMNATHARVTFYTQSEFGSQPIRLHKDVYQRGNYSGTPGSVVLAWGPTGSIM